MPLPLAPVADLLGPLKGVAGPVLPGVYLVLGICSLGWGAGVWRWVRIASGIFFGVALGVQLGVAMKDPQMGLFAGAVFAVGAAVVFYLVERAAIAVLGGAVAGLLASVIWPLAQHGQAATPVVLGGAGLVGTLLGAFLHQPAIKGVTAMFGAFLVTQAFGYGDRAEVILGLGAAGWAWQMWGKGGTAGTEPKAKKKAKS